MRYYKPNNSTLLYLNSSYNCVKTNSITITKVSGGSGYLAAPNIIVNPASNDTGTGASATCSLIGSSVDTVTILNNGSGYTKLPTITVSSDSNSGRPGEITGYTGLVGGSGYTSAPTISVSGGGGGSNFAGFTSLTPTTVSSTLTITSGGTGYITGENIIFDNTGTGGNGVVATIIATAGAITGITIVNAGGNYTQKAPTIKSIQTASGSGANISCNLVATSVASITITNSGQNYSTAPSFVFTGGGGTGASATPVINLGTTAVFSASFHKTLTYTWNIPDLIINDLGKLSVVNINATNFTSTTPYTYRIQGILYDNRNIHFSDYGNPILSIAQNSTISNVGSISIMPSYITLSPQTLRQITISVDDDITTIGSGQSRDINFVIALKIEEYNPEYEEMTDPYQQAISRIKGF